MVSNPTKTIDGGENMGKKLNDLKCKLIQKAVYAKLYKGHKSNEWEPWKTPGVTTLSSGLVCRNDIKFSDTYPNSFADIWYADDSHAKRPTIVYFHGGGFIFGDKSSGDPMQAAGGGVGKLESMVAAGYNLVNANYALSPEYRFPAQIHQTDQLFRFLLAHESELGLDMSRVCLSGGSAGANITEIYAACVCKLVDLKMYRNGYHGFGTDNAAEKPEQDKMREDCFRYKVDMARRLYELGGKQNVQA